MTFHWLKMGKKNNNFYQYLAFPKTPTSETKCYTHGRIRKKFVEYFDPEVPPKSTNNFIHHKDARNYFTSVQMTISQPADQDWCTCYIENNDKLKAAAKRQE